MNKGSDLSQSLEKQMVWKFIGFTFHLLQSSDQWCDQIEYANASFSKTWFLAEKKLRLIWNFYVYMRIYKPSKGFIRINMLSTFSYSTTLASMPTWAC